MTLNVCVSAWVFIHEQAQSDALVEQYIEGRELYVGVVGNERLTTFPVWELISASCRMCRRASPRAR